MKTAVFDVDGTLVDSLPFWNNMAVNYLTSIEIKPEKNLNQILESLTVVEGVYYIKEKYNINKSYKDIRTQMDNLLLDFYKSELKLKPFVMEFLAALKNTNTRMVIASVTDEKLILEAFKRYGISGYFEFIQTSENTGLSKDDKAFYKLLMERLNLRADEIFLFEDSLYAMETAKKVGFNIIAVEDDYSKKDMEEIIKVSDIYIKNFGKLLPFLNLGLG